MDIIISNVGLDVTKCGGLDILMYHDNIRISHDISTNLVILI